MVMVNHCINNVNMKNQSKSKPHIKCLPYTNIDITRMRTMWTFAFASAIEESFISMEFLANSNFPLGIKSGKLENEKNVSSVNWLH